MWEGCNVVVVVVVVVVGAGQVTRGGMMMMIVAVVVVAVVVVVQKFWALFNRWLGVCECELWWRKNKTRRNMQSENMSVFLPPNQKANKIHVIVIMIVKWTISPTNNTKNRIMTRTTATTTSGNPEQVSSSITSLPTSLVSNTNCNTRVNHQSPPPHHLHRHPSHLPLYNKKSTIKKIPPILTTIWPTLITKTSYQKP